MKILRKGNNIVDWNIWKDKDTKEIIITEIEKLGCDWVPEKQIEMHEILRAD